MRTKVFEAATIDEAVEQILKELREDPDTSRSPSSRNNVVYFDGWDGLGASAVLRAVAQRLVPGAPEATAGLHFDQVVDIDCSKWESRRALQRVIAEQLNLPAWVMKILDRQDEEDDYYGVAQESRAELPQVVREMYQHIQKLSRRFLVIFHNGSGDEIDLASFCGFPLSGYSTNKVLWTFQGRFRLYPRLKVDTALNKSNPQGVTDVFLSAAATGNEEHWSYLVHQEAADLVVAARKCNTGHGRIIQLQQGQGNVDSDDEDDGPWRAADALQREMRLDVDYWQHNNLPSLPSVLVRCVDSMPYWTSPPYEVLLSPVLDMFPQFTKLGVLKLSHCTFNFSSPPLPSCPNLRIMWLDHCKDHELNMDGAPGKEDDIRRFFQRLWVLDVCYTRCELILSAHILDLMTQLRELNVVGAKDLDMGQLQGCLPNIHMLRVTKSTVSCGNCSGNNLILLGMDKMELLDFSGNRTTMSGVANISEVSTSNNCLETVIITDGCVGVKKFSFNGCAKLKHILLSGLFEDLRILDLSGTSFKMLDLSTMTARNLDELFLDGCEKLCAILWPPQEEWKSYLQKLHIDTTQSAAASSVELPGALPPSDYYWYISMKDARLLRSLVPFRNYFKGHLVHMEISSPNCHAVDVGGGRNEAVIKSGIAGGEQPNVQNKQTNDKALIYADATVTIKDQLFQPREGYGNAQTITQIWPCPVAPKLDSSNCYMYIQDKAMMSKSPSDHEEYATGNTITIPDFVCDTARILHVHDSLSITSIPGHARWEELRWCLVERCPKLEFIFTVPQSGTEQGGGSSGVRIFYYLRTLWISQLPKARFMWDMSKLSLRQIRGNSFEDLTMLHLDFCPRLIHVLPLTMPIFYHHLLSTIEIVWCGNLRTIFPLHSDTESHKEQQQTPRATTVEFPNLKRIHLHELPKLQSFCGSGRMYAPNLETIKVRGCWSLTRLPAVGSKKVECDCEKDWWEMLLWDGLQANHHPSLYRPTHPRYYKKILLRGSVLV